MAEFWKTHLQVLLITAMVMVIAACGGQPEDDLDIEDAFPPNLTVSDAAVAEGGELVFTLNIDYTQDIDVSVDYSVVDVSTSDGVDYPSVSGTVVIPAAVGILTASITIPTTQDTLDEDDEQLTLELANPVDTTIVDGSGTGTIIDDDPLPLISIYTVSINEGDVATVEVSLSEVSGRDVSVNYSTSDGSAVSGSDYVPASGALVIPAGSQSTSFDVTSVNDGIPETPLESLSVNLSSPSNAGAGVMSALVEIGDDDAGANPDAFIEDVTVVEPNDLVFNVTFSFPVPVAGSVDYQSFDGSASQALDYSAASGTALALLGATSMAITVTGLDDNVFEGTESFTLSLSNFVGLNNGDDLAVGTINDDEVMPDLVVYDVSVTEGGTLLFEVSLSGPTTAEVTYSLATTPGSASSGLDYAAVTAGATIAPLSLLNQHQVYTVDDSLDEDAEDLTLDLASVVGANPLDNSGVGTIGDNDAPPVVNISNVSVFEGGTLNFVASITALSSKEITFVYQTYDESATAGADYVGGSFLTTIPAGSSSVVLPVASIQELVDEPDETFAVSLGSLINVQAGVIGAQGTIQNDDVPPDLQILDSLVDEGDNAFVLVTLSHASGSDVIFDYTTVDGTATAAGDYVAETATITITPGNLFHLIGIVTVEDLIEETGELFSVSVTSLVGANPLDMNAVVAVTDDDIVPDAFIDDVSVTEGASAILSVTLDDIPTADVVINYQSYDGSAASPVDFSAISGQMTIATGNQTGALTVATVDDLIVESPEDFVVSLDVVSGGVVGDGLGSVTIFDNDVYPDIFVSDVTSEEGETFAFVVSLSIPAPQPVFFDFATADNTATQPGDYGAISGSSSLDTGELSVTFNVNTVENSVDQADRDFTFDISSVTFATVADASGLGTIVDDDARIDILDASGTEGDTVLFLVSLSKVLGSDIVFDYLSSGVSATDGVDYGSLSGTGTVPFGNLLVTLSSVLTDDLSFEGTETFEVSLSNLSANAEPGDLVGEGTITDNDAPPEIFIADATVEEGLAMDFVISLDQSPAAAVVVTYSTINGTAASGSDYTASSGEVTFAAAVSQLTLSIPGLDDAVEEGNEEFGVTLTGASGGIVNDGMGVGTILDNDTTIFISDAAGTEGDTIGFVVSLSQIVPSDVTFSFLSYSGTATDGVDYSAVSGVETLSAGASQITLLSVLTDDTEFESPTENFEVSLSGLSAGVIAGDLLADGSITDNDLPPQLFASDAVAFEGETLQFVVSLDQIAGQSVEFNYMTMNNTATAGSDYVATAGTGTIGAGILQITIAVNGLQDVAVEGDEVLDFNLSSPVNATITDALGVGTIQDDETFVYIDDISGNEGETLDFQVSLASALNVASSFEASTFFSGSANGSDLTLLSNFGVTLAAGETVTIVSVVTTDDLIYEGTETFGVSLSNLMQLEVGDDVATGTILDNEPAPQLYLSDVSVNEGQTAEILVTLSVLSEVDVIFDFEPASGTATVGSDFVFAMSQATLPMGDLAITITVDTLTDAIDEFDENFSVAASIVSGALAGDLVATVSLNDINPAPTLSVFNTGESEANQASVVVSLDAISAKPVTFNYQTYDSEATGGVDYQSASGTSILSAGSSQMTITVDFIEDFLAEADETFLFSLSGLVNADAGVDLGSVTIFDNDPSPAIYIDDAVAAEGNTMFFLATLSAINGQDSIFDVNTSDGTALAGADYTSYSATVTILSGGWAATIAINTLPDSIDEDAQGFSVDLSNLQNLNAGDIAGVGSITDDDPLPQLFINPSSENEGTNLTFLISMDRLSERDAGFDYQTYDGTASISDFDYSATSGGFTFAPAAFSTNVVVPVTTDLTVEGDETLTLSLSSANNLSFVASSAIGTIINNDFPLLDIYDASATEGSTVQFVASLSQASINDVIFTANTSSGTATSGADFTALSAVIVTIPSGSLQVNVDVASVQDVAQEGDEDFTLALSNISNASGGDTSAVGTIQDDDIINPTVVISTSEPDPTISDPILFNISFSDDVTGFALSDIVVGNGTKANFNQISPSFYRFYLYPTAEGIVSVDVPADSAIDGEGDGNLAALQLTLTWQEGLPPDPPTGLQLVDPLTSPSTDDTPVLRVSGLTSGNTVRIFSDGGCTTELQSATASGSTQDFTSASLPSGIHLFFANQSDGLGTSDCSSAYLQYEVTSGYIVTEDFEDSTIGPLWSQVATDDHDWTLNSGNTPSADVGPTGGSDGGTYIYTEASNPVAASEVFILESGSLDAGANQLNLEFKWNKRGDNMGDLYVEVSTNGGSTWDAPIWSHTGADVLTGASDAWRSTGLSLCGYGYSSGNILVRFRAVMPAAGDIFNSDIGLDEIVVKDGPCISVAITAPTEGQQFVDAQAGSVTVSGVCSEDGESVDISGAATASTTCSGGAFSTTVDLSSSYGDTNLIVQHTDGGTGLAVDTVSVYRSIISDDFESGTIGSNWTQAAYDQRDWTVQTGGTGSNNTGPSAAAAGTYYIYTEASNPAATGDEFIIESPSLDASVKLLLSFDYHMWGAAMGDLNIEVSTNGGSTWDAAIWNVTGDQGNQWRSASVNLCSAGYDTGNILVRFRGVRGTDFTSDIALDNIVVEPASSCVDLSIGSPLASTVFIDSSNDDSVAFSGSCSENGQNVVASGDATGSVACSGGTWSMNLDFTSAPEGPLTVFFEHENVGGDKARRSKTLEKVIQIDTFDGGALGSNWVQAAYDQRDWTVNSGGTPSVDVGPSDDATGGASYLYTEASNPVNASDEFVLESTVIDATSYNLGLQFQYNMRGDNMGALYVDVSDDGGSTWDLDVTSIGGQNANTGDPDVWSVRAVNLCTLGYTGNNIKIRFRAVMPAAGNVWNSDIAIDNLVLRNLSQCN